MVDCPDCGTFYNPGESGPMQQEGCPNCGRPYAHQPSPTQSEMTPRNMPAPGEADMGGNPLKEGILADNGWNNRMKRDESFASVRTAEQLAERTCPQCGGGIATIAGQYPPNFCTHCGKRYNDAELSTIGDIANLPTTEHPLGPQTGSVGDCTPLTEEAKRELRTDRWKTHSQRVYMPWHVASDEEEEPEFEVEEVVLPEEGSVKDKGLKKVIRNASQRTGDILDTIENVAETPLRGAEGIVNTVGDAAQGDFGGAAQNALNTVEHTNPVVGPGLAAAKFAWQHPATAATLAGGAALALGTGGAAIPEEVAAGGTALGEGAAADTAASTAPAAEGAAASSAGPAVGAAAGAGAASKAANWMKGAIGNTVGNAAKSFPKAMMNLGKQELQQVLLGNPLGAGGGYGAQGQQTPDARSLQQISQVRLAEDFESPSSHGEIPKDRDGDPGEKKDGDNQHWEKDFAEGDEGGNTESPHQMDATFSPDTASAFEMMFPLVLQYYLSDEDGMQDPLIAGLHQLLDQEIPGYLEHADEDHKVDAGADHGPDPHEPGMGGEHEHEGDDPTEENDKADNTDNTDSREKKSRVAVQESMPLAPAPGASGVPGGIAPSPTTPVPQMTGPSPNASKCVNGHTVDPSSTQCPQCGAPVIHLPPSTASLPDSAFMYEDEGNPMGNIPPGMNLGEWRGQLPEKQLVPCPGCGHLVSNHFDACPNCLTQLQPSQRLATDSQGPHTPEQIKAVQMYMHAQGRPLRDIFDVPTKPWAYAQELADIQANPNVPEVNPEDPQSAPQPPPVQTGPGAGMPMPPMSAPQMTAHTAADNIAEKCPKCDSHTTRLINHDGDTHCHSCGHVFQTKGLMPDDGKSTDTSVTANHPHTNPVGVPAADQDQQFDPRADRDTSLTWKDANGQPLRVGQRYELHSLQSDIPGEVIINEVKPNGINVTEVGEYGLGYGHEIRPEEASMYKYEFMPAGETNGQIAQPDIENNADNQTPYEGETEETDSSTPHEVMYSSVTAVSNPSMSPPTPAPASTPPNVQPPATSPMAPMGPGPSAPAAAPETASCPTCGGPINNGVCPTCMGGGYGQPGQAMASVNPALSWLDDDGSLAARMAGKQYSVSEQRDFINEDGVARNADKLDLSNTHYEAGFFEDRDLDSEFLW